MKFKILVIWLLISSLFLSSGNGSLSWAQEKPWISQLTQSGEMIGLTPPFTPAYLQGISIHTDNPLEFDFLIHKGQQNLTEEQKKIEYQKLVKYFLASLTIPDEDQWVNLSPYEKNRIIKDNFGKTEMGRDLLAQDYLLKQITSSLIYPEEGLGKKFWDKVYERAWKEYGTTNIPVNTFNKVWIIPDQAVIYESGNTAYVLKNHLKVMLESDYLAMSKNIVGAGPRPARPGAGLEPARTDVNQLGNQILREIILPELEREVNQGKNFANLRQIYSGMILATWYKHTLKESLLGHVYTNQSKVKGVDQRDTQVNQQIYQRYIQAFKKGVFNYVKEDEDKYSQQRIPRKYFSGGMKTFSRIHRPDAAMSEVNRLGQVEVVTAGTINFLPQAVKADFAQAADPLGSNSGDTNNSDRVVVAFADSFMTSEMLLTQRQEKVDKDIVAARAKLQELIKKKTGEGELVVLVHSRFGIKADVVASELEKLNLPVSVLSFATIAWEDPELGEKIITLFKGVIGDQRIKLEEATKAERIKSWLVLNNPHHKSDTATKPSPFISFQNKQLEKLFKAIALRDVSVLLKKGTLIKPQQLRESDIIDAFRGFNSKQAEAMIEEASIIRADFNTAQYKEALRTINSIFLKISQALEASVPFLPGSVSADQRRTATFVPTDLAKADVILHIGEGLNYPSDPRRMLTTMFYNLRETSSESPFSIQDALRKIFTIEGPLREKVERAMTFEELSKTKTDMAMANKVNEVGGIDLNSAQLDLQIKRDGKGVPLPLAQQNWSRWNTIEGFVPVIMEITPALGLPIFSELSSLTTHPKL